jgi:hypothetical protein
MTDNLHGLTDEEINAIKAEQLKDFEEIKLWADKGCPECFEKGYSGWNHAELRYIVCGCVLKNAQKALEERNQESAGDTGIIDKCRTVFKMN